MDVERGVDVVRVAGWERFEWMRAGFSTRRGGVSSAFGGKSLNLGWKADDEDANVRQNRARFLGGLSGNFARRDTVRMVTVRQVHGDGVQVVRNDGRVLETAEGRAVLEGDGMVTDVPGTMLGIQVADCVPVLVADVRRRAVGAFHAGWRGTAAEIVGKGVARMREEFGTDPVDLVAAIGPSIGPCCYEVGEEVRVAFEERFPYGAELFAGRRLDLWEANRRQLVAAGVPAMAVTVLGECSACARDAGGERRYFSHRAEMGFTGRLMGVVGVVSLEVA